MKSMCVRDEDKVAIELLSERLNCSMTEVIHRMLEEFELPEPVVDKPVDPRAVAKAAGLKKYQGSPCKYGHPGERYVSTGQCVQCWRNRSRIRRVPGEDPAMINIRVGMLNLGAKNYISDQPTICCGNTRPRRWVKTGYCALCYTESGVRIPNHANTTQRQAGAILP